MTRFLRRRSPGRRHHRHRWDHRHRSLLTGAAIVLVLVLGGLSFFALALRKVPGDRRGAVSTGTSRAAPAFAVASTVPGPTSSPVASDSPITVTFTGSVDPNGPLPSLSPPVAGSWVPVGQDALSFEATAPLIPGAIETLTVPGGVGGVRDRAHQGLTASVTVAFKVAPNTVRLQQLLALTGYLPVTFTATGPAPAPEEMAATEPGTFAWRWSDPLSGLESHWEAGAFGPLTRGAIMTFEDQHHLTVDGLPGPAVWTGLIQAVAGGEVDPKPYDYVVVNKSRPENLTLFVNGAVKFSGILVNTGVPGVDTPDGTFPVFEHLTASDMSGTNLDGTKYDDPNVPWASYFYRGDALHGFVRASYGFPQSNGCVEMAIRDAAATWPYTPIGTLVTVTGPPA